MSGLDASSFDFWLGEWDCDFDGGRAVNSLIREHEGKVIVERFRVLEPRPFSGTSLSVFAEHDRSWRQTWVDDGGSYWAFVGTLVDGDPSFATPGPVDADHLFKRMVFAEITPDTFHWRWESSPDRRGWTVNWEIRYRRRRSQAG